MFQIVIPYNFSMDDQYFSKWAWMRSCLKFKCLINRKSETSLYVGIKSSYNLQPSESVSYWLKWNYISVCFCVKFKIKWHLMKMNNTDWCLNPCCFPYNLFSFLSCFECLDRVPFSTVMLSLLPQQRCFVIMVDMLNLLIIVFGWSMTSSYTFMLSWLHWDRKAALHLC